MPWIVCVCVWGGGSRDPPDPPWLLLWPWRHICKYLTVTASRQKYSVLSAVIQCLIVSGLTFSAEELLCYWRIYCFSSAFAGFLMQIMQIYTIFWKICKKNKNASGCFFWAHTQAVCVKCIWQRSVCNCRSGAWLIESTDNWSSSWPTTRCLTWWNMSTRRPTFMSCRRKWNVGSEKSI